MPELNPFQNLDLTRYGFGPEKQLVSPLLFKGLADLKPPDLKTQPVETPVATAGPYGTDDPSAGGAGYNPFDIAAGYENTGPDSSQTTAGSYLNTISNNKVAMVMLATLFPSVAAALKGADYLQNRGKEKTAAGRLPQTKPALTGQQEIDRATSAAAQQLAQQPLAQVQQARPVVQAPVLPPDLYGGPDAQPDYGGIDFSGYDLSDASGFTPF